MTVGAANAINGLPFANSLDGLTNYKQVYSSSAFSGPIKIDAISFFLDASAGSHNQWLPKRWKLRYLRLR
jgi:hypothetical protein